MKAYHFYALLINYIVFFPQTSIFSQAFYFGNDLSYVNEMEDCGAIFKENNLSKDPYQIYADHGNNLVRLRLWHTPNWYDELNTGNRYADFQDVRKSIQRAKNAGMQVLLDFHLSDNWADPNKQLVPTAWAGVVGDLSILQDSLQQYIKNTLLALQADNLLPEIVQIGNETNKGILLSQEDDNSGWVLNWTRNAALFNTAIQAIREVEEAVNKEIKIAIHIAGPSNAEWFFEQFVVNGVTDFDIMGISYYWAWHKPTTIEDTGVIIEKLLTTHPTRKVMIFETGYLWTWEGNDNANNIINEVHPDYDPPSPQVQKQWLIDLTQEVINSGGSGVIYWESAWVSTNCWTQWGQGSHQEHVAFFDFETNLLSSGGIEWMTQDYENLTSTKTLHKPFDIRVYSDSNTQRLTLEYQGNTLRKPLIVNLVNREGKTVFEKKVSFPTATSNLQIELPTLPSGIYFAIIYLGNGIVTKEKIWLHKFE